ncbi:MAG TPA: hypothetical protein VNO14_02870 [Blastocatellia bacterium]|nr:hypothetical protein [Blastocatellia bacterium]
MMANQIEPSKAAGGIKGALMRFIRRTPGDSSSEPQAPPTLRIAGYNLVLLDSDGQVAWTREWSTGSAFDFGPRWNLWVFCEFTNQTRQEVEIAEYEIELMNDEGQVVERFGSAFADLVVVVPGETRVFSGRWRL